MPSPFPGMDPYLEAHWGDVHARLVTYASDQLQSQLPGDLRARTEERVYLETPEEILRHAFYPDVRIVTRPARLNVEPEQGGVAVAAPPAEPLLVEVLSEPITESFIEVREAGTGGRVVTVIEVVSPANKRRGTGRTAYLTKRRELRHRRVNVVEIELLRDGKNVLALHRNRLPLEYQTTYRVCVWRASRPGAYEIYRVPLRERLPKISIPLRPTDKDAPLDLQALIEQCYRNGAYDDLDYSKPPMPPLAEDDTAWASELLKAHAGSHSLRGK